MSYNKYPKEMKEAVVSRILSGAETVIDISRETGINIKTLYHWRDAVQRNGLRPQQSIGMQINGGVKISLSWF